LHSSATLAGAGASAAETLRAPPAPDEALATALAARLPAAAWAGAGSSTDGGLAAGSARASNPTAALGGPVAVGVGTNEPEPAAASLALAGLPDADDGTAGSALALNNSLGARAEVLVRDDFAAATREPAPARRATGMAEPAVN